MVSPAIFMAAVHSGVFGSAQQGQSGTSGDTANQASPFAALFEALNAQVAGNQAPSGEGGTHLASFNSRQTHPLFSQLENISDEDFIAAVNALGYSDFPLRTPVNFSGSQNEISMSNLLQGQAGDAPADMQEQILSFMERVNVSKPEAQQVAQSANQGGAGNSISSHMAALISASEGNIAMSEDLAMALNAMDVGAGDSDMNFDIEALKTRASQAASPDGQAKAQAQMHLNSPATAVPQQQAAASAMPGKWFENAMKNGNFGFSSGESASEFTTGDLANIVKTQNAGNDTGMSMSYNQSPQQPQMLGGPGANNNPMLNAQGFSLFAGEDGQTFSLQSFDGSDLGGDIELVSVSSTPLNTHSAITGVGQATASAQMSQPSQVLAAALQRGAAKDGVQRLAISLNPSELGRVVVDIEMDAKKKMKVTVAVEKESALHMFQRDMNALEQTLQKAGIDINKGDLQFALDDGSFNFDQALQQHGEGQGDNNSRGQGGDGSGAGNHNEASDEIEQARMNAPGLYSDPSTGRLRYNALA